MCRGLRLRFENQLSCDTFKRDHAETSDNEWARRDLRLCTFVRKTVGGGVALGPLFWEACCFCYGVGDSRG